MSVNIKTSEGLNKIAGLYPQQQARLDNLGQTQISNPQDEQELIYDGTKWVNYYAKVLLTYDTFFQGKTITISQGSTTITETLPLNKTEILIFVGNKGIYEFSYGSSCSTSVDVETSGELYTTTLSLSKDTVSVTIYSAKGDTITYTDADETQKTVVFDSNSTSKTINIAIFTSGISIEFTSLIALNPDNLSNNYSKTITVTENTTDIYLMPDNVLYWFGYESNDLEDCTTANGWNPPSNNTLVTPVHQTNYINVSSSTNQVCAVGSKSAITSHKKSYSIVEGVTAYANTYGNLMITPNSNKSVQTYIYLSYDSSQTTVYNKEVNMTYDTHIMSVTAGVRAHRLYALWYELQ